MKTPSSHIADDDDGNPFFVGGAFGVNGTRGPDVVVAMSAIAFLILLAGGMAPPPFAPSAATWLSQASLRFTPAGGGGAVDPDCRESERLFQLHIAEGPGVGADALAAVLDAPRRAVSGPRRPPPPFEPCR